MKTPDVALFTSGDPEPAPVEVQLALYRLVFDPISRHRRRKPATAICGEGRLERPQAAKRSGCLEYRNGHTDD